jgi:hypothetical protein
MLSTSNNRRTSQRFGIHMPIHFRVSQRGAASRWGSGTTGDFSSTGVRFRCRRALPVGAHIEMIVDWPAMQEGLRPIHLHATGFIVRANGNQAAACLTCCRFEMTDAVTQSLAATA